MDPLDFDPHHVGLVGYLHLVFFGLVLPQSAFRSARIIRQGPLPDLGNHITRTIILMAILGLFSLLVADVEYVGLVFNSPTNVTSGSVLAAGFLAVCVACNFPRWRRNVIAGERRVYLYMPLTTAQKAGWCLVSLAAGIGEEITYRGVMYVLLWRLTGQPWLAMALVAGVFAISHYLLGWLSMVILFLLSLGLQAIVLWTDSLVFAMAVHAAYDVIAGMTYAWLGRKYHYKVDASATTAPASQMP